jgi:hypothetical protein
MAVVGSIIYNHTLLHTDNYRWTQLLPNVNPQIVIEISVKPPLKQSILIDTVSKVPVSPNRWI